MSALPRCPRCGGTTYRDDDPTGGLAWACLMCGQRTWPTPPRPWERRDRYHGRLPVWKDAEHD
jgi:rRNA maturation protein Nop10